MNRMGLLSLLIAALPFSPTSAQQAQRGSSESPTEVRGTWLVVSVNVDGRRLSYETNNKWAIREHSIVDVTGALQTANAFIDASDVSKRPKTLDLRPVSEADKTKVMFAIYDLAGHALRICFAPVGKTRPTAFESQAGTGNVLWVFKRDGS